MKTLAMALACAFVLATSVCGETDYVDGFGGMDHYDGTFDDPWATIQHAIDQAEPYDTIYVRTEIYDEAVVIDKVGLTLIGYNGLNLNSLENGEGVPDDYDDFYDNAPQDDMPTIDIGDRSVAGGKVAVYITASDVSFRNFQICNAQDGIRCDTDIADTRLKNLVVHSIGDPTASQETVYQGRGITVIGTGNPYAYDDVSVMNCFVLNCTVEGYDFTKCSSCWITNCQAYCDDASNSLDAAMDYYFVIIDSRYCIVSGCRAERKLDPTTGNSYSNKGPGHGGHGYTLQGTILDDEGIPTGGHSYENIFVDCFAEGLAEPILVRGNCDENVFENVISSVPLREVYRPGDSRTAYGQVSLVNGPYNNEFIDLVMEDSYVGVSVYHGWLFGDNEQVDTAAEYNTFDNCEFDGCEIFAVEYAYYSQSGSYSYYHGSENNLFTGCTFIDGSSSDHFVNANRRSGDGVLGEQESSNNDVFDDCVIVGFSDWKTHNSSYYEYDLGITINNSIISWNSGFPSNSSLGTGNSN